MHGFSFILFFSFTICRTQNGDTQNIRWKIEKFSDLMDEKFDEFKQHGQKVPNKQIGKSLKQPKRLVWYLFSPNIFKNAWANMHSKHIYAGNVVYEWKSVRTDQTVKQNANLVYFIHNILQNTFISWNTASTYIGSVKALKRVLVPNNRKL